MTTTINASTSAGLVNTADTSGVLALQTANTTALSISASQVVTLTNALPVASGGTGGTTSTGSGAVVLGTSPTITTPTISSLSSASATALTLQSAGTTAVTISTSQNVGIGVTPSAWTSSFKALQINTGGTFYGDYNNTTAYFGNNSYFDGSNWKYISSSYALYAYQDRSAGKHVWANAPSGTAGNNITWTEAMTLDSSGNLLVGCTALPSASVTGWGFDKGGGYPRSAVGTTANSYQYLFYNPNGLVGAINTSGSATSYNTSSDYRLKENIAPMTGALAKVAQLKPVTYKWKVDGSDGEGFIAHELAEVCPHAVTGEKDAVDADGKPVYQGIDVSFLVATLTAALQETKALIDTQAETINALTARIVALEAK
jgi:hypothetical protein